MSLKEEVNFNQFYVQTALPHIMVYCNHLQKVKDHHLAAGGSYWSLLLWFMLGWQFMPASANHIYCWVDSFERSIAKEELISGRTKLFRKATLCAKQNWSVHKLRAHLVDMSKFLGLVRRKIRSKQTLCCALAAQHSAGCTCRCAWC